MAIRTFSSLVRALHQTSKAQSYRFFSTLLHDPPSPDLVNEISRVLSDHRNPKDDLEHTLCVYSPRVSSNLVEQVLKRCKNLGFPAHRFFLWARRIPDFEHSLDSYHILVEILGSSKQFTLLWDFLIEAREYNYFEFSPKVFWIVFRAYSRANLPSEASRAFNRMIEFGIKPCVDDLDQLLHSLCDRKHVTFAQEVFDKAKVVIIPNAKTYSILIRGWGRVRDAYGARKVFDEMLDRNCNMDLLAYNALLDALCKSSDVDGAYKMFLEMSNRGLKPDAYSYAIFIHTYCDAGDVHSAYKVLDRMKRYDLVPNVYTYNHIIKTLCTNEKVDDAYLLLDEMIQKGANPDTWTYNSILAYHCDHCEVNRATNLLSRMDRTKCLPDRHTYNMVLKLLTKIGRFDQATEIWEGMSERKFYPTVATYTVMIHGLVRKKALPAKTNGYIRVVCYGGLNQMRRDLCDGVGIARLLNATLVLPKFEVAAYWNESSGFADVFDVDYFIQKMNGYIEVVKELPKDIASKEPFKVDCSKRKGQFDYIESVFPSLLEHHYISFTPAMSQRRDRYPE